ncbi:uncharacterized protein LOC130994319 [Salvia miltiorrhiza]|uniref:uncharacterized protein LOC130994319 n=1 Tax=Salvia miltiorrhiza TaxID=226208 RepID=UPI0025ACBFA9|nr:uncharacterized protein LOC130994319 [Salvia miltiorrhiza]
MTFIQGADEPFHEAWERFQELLRQCPQHQLAPAMLSQFFYDGLIHTSQFMVDSTAGGNIARKTAAELNQIFQTLAESSQRKTTRGRRVEANAVGPNCELQKQMATMMRELQQLKMSKVENPPVPVQNAEGCGICGDFGHGANNCHRMGEFPPEGQAETYAVQGHYNSGWRNQAPSGSGSSQGNQFRRPPQQMGYQNQPQYFPPQQNFSMLLQQPPQPMGPSLEDTMQSFMQASKQAMEAQNATIKRLENTVGQLTGALNQLQQSQQTENPQLHQAHAIELVEEDAHRTAGKWRSKTVEAMKINQQPSPPLPQVQSTQPLPK